MSSKPRWVWLVVVENMLMVHELSNIVGCHTCVLQPQRDPILIVAFKEKLGISA
jgi:hypothetical protein